MLMPQDPIRKLNGITEPIFQSLENIGIRYVLQIVTMTRSQILCIKGINESEVNTIAESLLVEGMSLALTPLEFILETEGEEGLIVAKKKISVHDFHGTAESTEVDRRDPARDPRLKDVKMGIHENNELGMVEFVFPVPMLKVQFRPHNAIAIAEIIVRKAQSLLLLDGAEDRMVM